MEKVCIKIFSPCFIPSFSAISSTVYLSVPSKLKDTILNVWNLSSKYIQVTTAANTNTIIINLNKY